MVDETAEIMFQKPDLNKLKSIYDTISQLFRTITQGGKNGVEATAKNTPNWTGQHTDIAFVDNTGVINVADIESIQDKELRANVFDSYNNAVSDGYLQFNSNGDYTLTDKGREHINSNAFIEQFEKDQSYQIANNKARIELKGNASDLNVFRYTNSIDLNHLAVNDPAKFKQVQRYFDVCKQYGFVDISDGIVTPTEKCKEYLEQQSSKHNISSDSISQITPDDIQELASQKVKEEAVAGKSATVDKTAKVTANTAQGTKTTTTAANAAQAAKTTTTAANTAKAAGSASKAAGAASSAGGVAGVAVSAAVQLTQKGSEMLNEAATTSPKIQRR